MPLVPAKCTQCGSNVEVDDSKEAAICSHCGTPFIVEKAITNYNVNIGTVNVQGANADNYAHLGDEAMTTKEYDKALDYYTKVVELIGDTRYDIHMLRLVLFLKTGKMDCEQVLNYMPEYFEHLRTDTQTLKEIKVLRQKALLQVLFDTLNNTEFELEKLAKCYKYLPSEFQAAFQARCDNDINMYKSNYLNASFEYESAILDDLKRAINAKNIINPKSPPIIVDKVVNEIRKKKTTDSYRIIFILFVIVITLVILYIICSYYLKNHA